MIGFQAVLILIFCFLSSLSPALLLFAEACLFLITFVWILSGYLMQKKRIEKLNQTISQLGEAYLLGEVLDPPKNEIEACYFKVMKTISRSAIGTVESARKEKEEYCEYVEQWIHEIKTPLTACSLILENGGNVKKLNRELKRADNLTETILYYARLKSANKDTLIRTFHVLPVIQNAIKDQMSLLIAAGISIDIDGDFTVASDDKALSFMISQLLINTAKYCPACQIKIKAKDGVIEYTDHGIGIPSFELARITERGFTGTNGRTLGNSTGMGLYIVSELCKHLEMTLNIESLEHEYSRFTLSYDSLTKM